jgi:hypothetical protein
MNVLDPAFEENSYSIPLRILFLSCLYVGPVSRWTLACESHGQVSELPRIKHQLLASSDFGIRYLSSFLHCSRS